MSRRVTFLVASIITLMFVGIGFLLVIAGCNGSIAGDGSPAVQSTGIVVPLGVDISKSMTDYEPLDTGFVAHVCRCVASSGGGVVVVYSIGQQSDKSGLRCPLKAVPRMQDDLVLSKKAELVQKIRSTAADNEKEIQAFLVRVKSQVFDQQKSDDTDIIGFFRKVDVLLNEPQFQGMEGIIFCHSDGMQSVDGIDSPAHYNFRAHRNLILCLSGWKVKPPCDSTEIKAFENPTGFVSFLEQLTSMTN